MRDDLLERLHNADETCGTIVNFCAECASMGECADPGEYTIFKEAADAIEELVAAVPTWISVEERLPEDFQKVLVFWWEHGEPMIDTAFWQKDAKRFDGEHWVRMEDKVTHWMPLPEPPKGGVA